MAAATVGRGAAGGFPAAAVELEEPPLAFLTIVVAAECVWLSVRKLCAAMARSAKERDEVGREGKNLRWISL